MRAKLHKERTANKALDFLKNLGIATEELSVTTAIMVDNAPENKVLQGEAALLFLNKPERFITKKCDWKECGEYFGTSYRSVAYCSNACRGKAFKDQTGMDIDWSKSAHERWGGDPPLIIDPDTLKNLAWLMQEGRLGKSPTLPSTESEPEEVLVASPENKPEATERVVTPTIPLDSLELETLLAEVSG